VRGGGWGLEGVEGGRWGGVEGGGGMLKSQSRGLGFTWRMLRHTPWLKSSQDPNTQQVQKNAYLYYDIPHSLLIIVIIHQPLLINKRSFELFMCFDLVSEPWQSFLFQIFQKAVSRI